MRVSGGPIGRQSLFRAAISHRSATQRAFPNCPSNGRRNG